MRWQCDDIAWSLAAQHEDHSATPRILPPPSTGVHLSHSHQSSQPHRHRHPLLRQTVLHRATLILFVFFGKLLSLLSLALSQSPLGSVCLSLARSLVGWLVGLWVGSLFHSQPRLAGLHVQTTDAERSGFGCSHPRDDFANDASREILLLESQPS
jgi:hypothetical protein